MPKAPAKAKQLFCESETFMEGGETLAQLLAKAVKALMARPFDASMEENPGAAHGR